jgi:hypothetical protein
MVFEGEVNSQNLGFQLDNHIINDITITTAIARKLCLTLVIQETLSLQFVLLAWWRFQHARTSTCDFRGSSTIQFNTRYSGTRSCAAARWFQPPAAALLHSWPITG